MAILFSRLGSAAPNFVELDNNPDQSSPWVTNYASGATSPAPLPAKKTSAAIPKKSTVVVKAAAPAASPSSKVKIKRTGTGAELLDKLLPLVVDQAGNRTIYGLPPIVVYVAGGVISSALIMFLYRLLTEGGGGRRRATVSNPKSGTKRRRRAKR